MQFYPEIMKNAEMENLLDSIQPESCEYLNRIYDLANKKEYEYNANFIDRFFATDRTAVLTEVRA